MSVKTKAVISIIINIAMTIITTAIVISYFNTKNFLITTNEEIFYYFTTDSNLLACIGGIVVSIFEIQMLRGKRTEIPKAAIILKFSGVVTVMITLITCLIYLAPTYGFGFIFGSTFFHMHLSGPLMAFISFCFFEKGERLSILEAQFAHIPCAIYTVIYFVMVFAVGEANGGWRDLYHFGDNGTWYIALIALTILEIIVLFGTRLVYNIGKPKKN